MSARVENGRASLLAACKRLIGSGLTAGTWGNISLRTGVHTMLITPSGMPYDTLTEADFAVVDLRDLSHSGPRKPSIESPMHAALYNARGELNAIMHTHAVYSSAASLLGHDLPPQLEDMAQIVGPSVRVVPHAFPGSDALRDGVLAGMQGRFAALLQGHGAICAGRSLDEAFTVCAVLEKAAQVHLLTQNAPQAFALSDADAHAMRAFYLDSYAKRD